MLVISVFRKLNRLSKRGFCYLYNCNECFYIGISDIFYFTKNRINNIMRILIKIIIIYFMKVVIQFRYLI